jgi:capsular polysaccharide biosynthesis protein
VYTYRGALWYQSCQSPPFHPYLWKKMRERFGYRELPFADRNTIVYLGRGKRSGQTYNSGRSVINEDQLIDRLEAFIALRNREREAAGQADKLELVVFNHADFATLQETIAFFNRAKVLIGACVRACACAVFDELAYGEADSRSGAAVLRRSSWRIVLQSALHAEPDVDDRVHAL